ncbi:MAG: TolC family protein [Pseudomonadota bacterium]
MLYKKITVFFLLSLATTHAYSLDLWSVYALALKQDATLKIAQQKYLVDQQTAVEGKSLLRPNVSANARVGKSFYDSDSPNYSEVLAGFQGDLECVQNNTCLTERLQAASSGTTSSKYTSQSIGLNLTQPIYDKTRWHEYKKLQILSKKGAVTLNQTHADLIYRTAEAYLTALQALNNLKQGRAEHTDLRRQLRFAQRQLQKGFGRASDLYELRTADQLKSSQAQILQSGLKAALSELSALVGRRVHSKEIQRLEVKIPVKSLKPHGEQAWIGLAKKYNALVQDATLEAQFAAEELKLKKSARQPKVNLFANYNNSKTSGGQGFVPGAETKFLGVDITAPLYQGGAMGAAKKKAQYQSQASEHKLKQQQQRLSVSVAALYAQIQGSVRTFSILTDSLSAAQRAESNLSHGASKGVVSVAELHRAKEKTASIRGRIEALRFEYLLNKLKLRQLVGVLNARDLKAINSLLAAN